VPIWAKITTEDEVDGASYQFVRIASDADSLDLASALVAVAEHRLGECEIGNVLVYREER